MIKLETITFPDGTEWVRPAGALGTCGWSPQAWVMAYKPRWESPKSAFLAANPNWSDA